MPEEDYTPVPLKDTPSPEGVPSQLADQTARLHLYLRFAAILLSICASPLIAHCVTKQVEGMRLKFEENDRKRKRAAELQLHKQKLRHALIKEILVISKTADLDNVAHAYRLGWIAEMVEANPKVFDLNMKDAKEKLDKVIEKIGVVDNIRTNLLAARKSESNLKVKVDKYDKTNTNLEKKLGKAKKVLRETQWRSYAAKKKWQDKISDMEKDPQPR